MPVMWFGYSLTSLSPLSLCFVSLPPICKVGKWDLLHMVVVGTERAQTQSQSALKGPLLVVMIMTSSCFVAAFVLLCVLERLPL